MAKAAPEAAIAPEILSRYEPVIGLETHVQLKTASKIFCACSARFGDPPNHDTCPVCLGLPGALPVLNLRALELAVKAALALNATVHERSRFARKNYFYPDLPKGYQISMYELPLATGGHLEIEHEGRAKRIGITRLHLEDDAAKGMHEGFPDSARNTYIDFNRGGVPLVEIVSEPDMRSPAEARAYLDALKQVLLYTEVSDVNMEEGSLRCDANLSIRPRGAEKFGVKTEVKNLNSFRYLERALEYEIERQVQVIESGGRVEQETRLWNVSAGRTEPMRSKEYAHDYRYFPEPDLLPVRVSEEMKGRVRAEMPELPAARRARFVSGYGITPYDAGVLTATRALADYFEAAVRAGAPAKSAANWIQGELLRLLKDSGKTISETPISPASLAKVIALSEKQLTTASGAKATLAIAFKTGEDPDQIVQREGFAQITDAEVIERACREAIEKSPEQVARFRAGNEGVFKFLVGQVMRATRGQANPQAVNDTLRRLLGEK
jgi:aspartyl-tRNA(Asn)/glutamyl-tRNA(Gln) amidotransferase subunit B